MIRNAINRASSVLIILMLLRLQNRQIHDRKRQTTKERLEKRIRKRQRIREVW